MSKALIAAAQTNPSILRYPAHSSEALEGPAISHPENHGEGRVFAFSDHWLTRYYQQSLWQQHPLLFLLLVYYAQRQDWSDQQWLQCCQQSLQNLLAMIDLPATEANYRVLMDATELDEDDELNQWLNFSQSELAALYQCFKNDSAACLSADAALHRTITHLLKRAPMSKVEFPILNQ